MFAIVPDPIYLQPVIHPSRARMSYRRTYRRSHPLSSRKSFFSPRQQGTVVPLR